MRLSIRHEIAHTFEAPVRSVIEVLRLSPRNHEGQHVIDWRIDVDAECIVRPSEDSFGNAVHTFTADGPLERISIIAEGEVDTFSTTGFVRNAAERFPPELFLRAGPYAMAGERLRALAASLPDGPALGQMHGLQDVLHEAIAFDPRRANAGDAEEALKAGVASAEGLANAFIACARELGAPARFVSGYVMSGATQDATMPHAWAEAWIESYGWIAFDPASGRCPEDRHVRIAAAPDALAASTFRVAAGGGARPATTHVISLRAA